MLHFNRHMFYTQVFLDNCEQLRLMQDVAIVEELPEIRDSIEFCENMVDTHQQELNGLRGFLPLSVHLLISYLSPHPYALTPLHPYVLTHPYSPKDVPRTSKNARNPSKVHIFLWLNCCIINRFFYGCDLSVSKHRCKCLKSPRKVPLNQIVHTLKGLFWCLFNSKKVSLKCFAILLIFPFHFIFLPL